MPYLLLCICFHGEIRKITIFSVEKKNTISGALLGKELQIYIFVKK